MVGNCKKGRKRKHWYFALFLLAGAVLAGCGGKGAGLPHREGGLEEEELPVLSVFDINAGNHTFDDRIAQEIMKRTGVRIQMVGPTEDHDEKVNLMLAYRDYPDMILVDLGAIGHYQSAGALVDLEPYMGRLPNVKAMYGEMLNRLRTEDGELFYLSNWYGKDEDAVAAFHIRYDYMCQVVGKERADSDQPFTQEEFLDLLRRFKEKYPEIGGQASIPFSLCIDIN